MTLTDVVILARTDARAAVGGGLDEVLRRCEAYLEKGVDMLMVMALQSREEVRRVTEAFPGTSIHFNTTSVKPPLADAEYGELGAATYNVSISKVAQLMMERFLSDCHARGAAAFNDLMEGERSAPHGTLGYLNLTGFPAVLAIERRFLPADQLAKYESSIGEYDPRAKVAARGMIRPLVRGSVARASVPRAVGIRASRAGRTGPRPGVDRRRR